MKRLINSFLEAVLDRLTPEPLDPNVDYEFDDAAGWDCESDTPSFYRRER